MLLHEDEDAGLLTSYSFPPQTSTTLRMMSDTSSSGESVSEDSDEYENGTDEDVPVLKRGEPAGEDTRTNTSSLLVKKFTGILVDSKRDTSEAAQTDLTQALEGRCRMVEFTVSPTIKLTREPTSILSRQNTTLSRQDTTLSRQDTSLGPRQMTMRTAMLQPMGALLQGRLPVPSTVISDIELHSDMSEQLIDHDECDEASVKPPDGEFGDGGQNYGGDVTACGVAPQKVATEIGDQGLSAKLSRLGPCPTKESDVLSMPLNECLTKASSCMLQMGLTFDVCNGNSASSKPPPSSQLRKPTKEYRDSLRTAMWSTIVTAYTHAMWHRHVRQAKLDQLVARVLPMMRRLVWVKKRKAARQFLSAIGRTKMGRVMPAKLRSAGNLFADWPSKDLIFFGRKLYAQSFRDGEYICHQGDPARTLYILMQGSVDVLVRDANNKSKSRSKRTGITVATLKAPCVFGDYGVFAGEPRSATIVCKGTVHTWACSQEVLTYHLSKLPQPVFEEINTRFATSMARIYKVYPAQLENSVLFQGWDTDVLQDLIGKLEPVVFLPHSVIFEAGKPGNSLYFICSGRCEGVHFGPNGSEQHHVIWGAGEQLGIRSIIFPEPQFYQVTALTTVQAWRLDKQQLMNYMLSRPQDFLAVKDRTNALYSTFLERPPICVLKNCSPQMEQLPEEVIERFYDAMQPRMLEPRAVVAHEGEPVSCLWFLTHGSCADPLETALAGSVLGLDHVEEGRSCWQYAVVTMERTDCWVLPLADMASVLRSFKKPKTETGRNMISLQKQLKLVLDALPPCTTGAQR
jgi:CRP-like cAMP-binding protein